MDCASRSRSLFWAWHNTAFMSGSTCTLTRDGLDKVSSLVPGSVELSLDWRVAGESLPSALTAARGTSESALLSPVQQRSECNAAGGGDSGFTDPDTHTAAVASSVEDPLGGGACAQIPEGAAQSLIVCVTSVRSGSCSCTPVSGCCCTRGSPLSSCSLGVRCLVCWHPCGRVLTAACGPCPCRQVQLSPRPPADKQLLRRQRAGRFVPVFLSPPNDHSLHLHALCALVDAQQRQLSLRTLRLRWLALTLPVTTHTLQWTWQNCQFSPERRVSPRIVRCGDCVMVTGRPRFFASLPPKCTHVWSRIGPMHIICQRELNRHTRTRDPCRTVCACCWVQDRQALRCCDAGPRSLCPCCPRNCRRSGELRRWHVGLRRVARGVIACSVWR